VLRSRVILLTALGMRRKRELVLGYVVRCPRRHRELLSGRRSGVLGCVLPTTLVQVKSSWSESRLYA